MTFRLRQGDGFLNVYWWLGVNICPYPAVFTVDSKNVIYNNGINGGAVIMGSSKLTQ